MQFPFWKLVVGLGVITTIIAGASFSLQGTSAEARVPANDQKPKPASRPLDQWPMECEGAAARLDFAVIDTQKLEGAHLIIIARLGTGETSARLNRIRLAAVEEYVLRRGSDFKYVLAEGAKVKGLGRLELYVGGRLKEIMPYERNAKGFCIHGGGG